MAQTERIREAFERNVKAMTLKPTIGLGTSRATCRITDGLTCEATDGRFTVVADVPKTEGGNNQGPTPGFFVRAGLGSCCAISYAMRAARYGVPIESIEVEVEADFDARGAYGFDDVVRGFTEVRYLVTVKSAAPEADILKVIEEADEFGAMLEVVRDAVEVKREVKIVQPVGA